MAELPKRYDPNSVEPRWYQQWLRNRDFVADPESSKPAFSIVMPPPNITGVLTLGHVLNDTIQDVLARRARMHGFDVLWLPGHVNEVPVVAAMLKTRPVAVAADLLRRVVEIEVDHNTFGIEKLTINSNTLSGQFISHSGKILDSFTITK